MNRKWLPLKELGVGLMIMAALAAGALFATKAYPGELKPAEVRALRGAVTTPEFRAKQNEIAHSSLTQLSMVLGRPEHADREFTHVIKRWRVTNQAKSGRCWLFAGLNVVRLDTANELGVSDFEFSENYLFFFHKLEGANSVLTDAMDGRVPDEGQDAAWILRGSISDGGYWGTFTALADKYGVVPKSAMPETVHSSNTGELNYALDQLVKSAISRIWAAKTKKAKQAVRAEAIRDTYKLLALTLGTPPEDFAWRFRDKEGKLQDYKTYTPKSFYEEFVASTFADKVHLMNDPTLPYYKVFSLSSGMVGALGDTFLNVPFEELEAAVKGSVLADRAVWFGSDVGKYMDRGTSTLSEKQFDFGALLGLPLSMDKATRLRTYATQATHAMVIVGVDMDGETPVKWLVENSWGTDATPDAGYFTMTNGWLREYGFDAVVDIRFVSEKAVAALTGGSEILPIWHHMNGKVN